MSQFKVLLVAALLAGFGAFAQDSNPPAPPPPKPADWRAACRI